MLTKTYQNFSTETSRQENIYSMIYLSLLTTGNITIIFTFLLEFCLSSFHASNQLLISFIYLCVCSQVQRFSTRNHVTVIIKIYNSLNQMDLDKFYVNSKYSYYTIITIYLFPTTAIKYILYVVCSNHRGN